MYYRNSDLFSSSVILGRGTVQLLIPQSVFDDELTITVRVSRGLCMPEKRQKTMNIFPLDNTK